MKMKVVVRNWTLKKFSDAAYRRAKKVGVARKLLTKKFLEQCYDDMYSVVGCVAKAEKLAAK